MKLDLAKYNKQTLGGIFIHAFIAFCILVILGLAYFYMYLPSVTNHGESVTVPNIEGMPIDQVEEFLVKHDLRFEVNDSSYSSKYPPLTVLKQFPAAGAQVKENRKVYVSVNRVNPPTVPMPDILNTSLINAEAVLKALRTNTAYLQSEVARRVNTKYAAKLKFLLDESFDEGSHIDALLRSPKVAPDLEAGEER